MLTVAMLVSWYALAQLAINYPDLSAIFLAYGPLGVFCVYFMVRDERRDKSFRETMHDNTDRTTKALEAVSHKLNGLSRALIFNAATNAPNGIKEMAQKELERMDSSRRQDGERE